MTNGTAALTEDRFAIATNDAPKGGERIDYWGHLRGRQHIETVPHPGMRLLVEDVRMSLERMPDDSWSKETPRYMPDVSRAGRHLRRGLRRRRSKIMRGNPNTDNPRYYGAANPSSLGYHTFWNEGF